MTGVNILQGGSLKVDDTTPPFRAQCLDTNGNPFNLTGYDVQFKMRRSDSDSNDVDASATVEQADRGIIEYEWQSSDTDTAGMFKVELVADDNSGNVVTFPNFGYENVYIEEGL